MQWNWLVRTKLLLAGLALIFVIGDGVAGPFKNRKNKQSQDGQWTMVDQTTTTQAQAQPAQPGTQPAVTASTQTQQQQGQWVMQPQGRKGKKSVMVWQPTTQVVTQQPVAGQPAAGQPAAGQPAVEAAPMPSTTPSVSTAQPTYQEQGNQRRGGRRAARRGNGNGNYATSPTTSIQPGTTRQSFYPVNGQSAYIDVRVPVANAQVMFDGAATNQQGTNRLFVTPALNQQGNNTYEVEARWTGQDGNAVKQTRQVKVPPGARVLVDFTIQQP